MQQAPLGGQTRMAAASKENCRSTSCKAAGQDLFDVSRSVDSYIQMISLIVRELKCR